VATSVSNAVRGQNLRKVRSVNSEIDVILALQNVNKQSVDDLKNLPISIEGDRTTSLSTLASFEQASGPGRIFRQDRKTSMGIAVNLEEGMTPDDARDKLRSIMNQIVYPAGYSWSYGRSFSNDDEAMGTMLFNIGIAFFLIYLVMASLFE